MQALILDFDGTIVNSEPLHEEAIREVLRPLGVSFTSDDFERRCLGFGAYRALTNLLDDGGCAWDDDLVATLFERKSAVLRVAIEAGRMPIFEGALDLVREASGT
ncbi:MAG: HAD family phosphatase, partial [Phycisphaerales bacterium]|nr:HAD family phosphatase [Phycisphaerales bacterium]